MSRVGVSPVSEGAGILVLFDRLRCAGYAPDRLISGGAQRKSFQLAQFLAAGGNRVFFGSDDQPGSGAVRQLAASGITHVRLPFRSPGWLSAPLAFARLIRLVRQERINVIHSHDRWTAMFGRCAAFSAGVEYFYTAHITFSSQRATAPFFGRNVTAVSEAVKANLTTYFGMDAANVQVIPNGESIAPPTAQQCQAIRERYGVDPRHRVIACIGRLNLQKGHSFLLQALARVTRDYPGLKCFVVGDGDQRVRLETMTRELGLEQQVVFCGAQDHVAPFIHVAEFTVLSSISEGLPIAALESLLLGVPVVASRVGGVPEVVVDGLNGRLVEPRDVRGLAAGIGWMLENRDQVRRMGTDGVDSVRTKFSLERMLSAYEQYYRLRLRTAFADRRPEAAYQDRSTG